MSTTWTKEQAAAIEMRNTNLLVSAAAGSGKTAVLVERILTLMLEERVPIDRFLIVTFTRAAASEMKERIQKKLSERRKELLLSDAALAERELLQFMNDQIQAIPNANISTLHSFCIGVLQEHFALAGIDPGFKQANEALSGILSSNAMLEVLDAHYESEDAAFLSLVSDYGGNKQDQGLIDMILSVDRFVQSQPDPEGWLNAQVAWYEEMSAHESDEALRTALIGSRFTAAALSQLQADCALVREQLEAASERTLAYEPPVASCETIQLDLMQLERIEQALEEDPFAAVAQLSALEFPRYKTIPKKQKEEVPQEELEAIKSLRDEAKKRLIAATERLDTLHRPNLLADFRYISAHIRTLVSLVLAYRTAYQAQKAAYRVLDFSDLEHLTLKVLESEDARQELAQRYDYIFYDEYQDTNLVQETIIERIKRADNLFFVGDVKQSIYRFRLADPNLFNRRYARYGEEPQSRRIDLSRNFRSRAEILDFCNLLFNHLMSERYGEVDYRAEGHQLIAGKSLSPYEDHIEIAILEHGDAAEAEGTDQSSEEAEPQSAVALEAQYIANKIRELVGRGIAYKDIAILMRSPRDKIKVFEEVFAAAQIPLYVDYQSSSYETLEIKLLLEYLKVIDNPKQDEALLAAMRSLFGGFTDEELLCIRAHAPKRPYYEAAEEYARSGAEPLRAKVTGFYDQIAADARRERMMGLGDFIWYIISARGLDTFAGALENGAQRKRNLEALIQKAREYEQEEARGLFGFLQQTQTILREKIKDSGSATILESENVVSLMSIHKSKGLEFGVVFVCNIEKKINETDIADKLLLHNELGMGLIYRNATLGVRDDTLPQQVLKAQKQREGISEELRILYVALTRAVDRLYLVGSVRSVEDLVTAAAKQSILHNLAQQRSYLAWIVNVLIRSAGGAALRAYTQQEPMQQIQGMVPYEVRILTRAQLEAQTRALAFERSQQEHARRELSEATRTEIGDYLNFAYPYQAETTQRIKTSVTELLKSYKQTELAEADAQPLLRKPLFGTQRQSFKAQELGSIVHLALELLEIQPYTAESLDQAIADLTARELLTEAEAQVLPRERLMDFFAAPLAERMARAERLYRERSFLMRDGASILHGIIDCYFEEEDGIVLLDYKTDSTIDPDRHRAQLALYKRAIEAMEGKRVKEAYIYWLAHAQLCALELD